MSGRAGQDVQLADAMHHAREHRFIWIHPGTGPREHIGVRRHIGAALPQVVQMRRKTRQLVGFANLIHREGNRRAAHHVVADACDGGAQISDVFPAAIDGGGIRNAQQTRRQRRLRSHHAHDLFNPRIGIAQDAPDLQRYLRKRRQVHVAAR